jgi:hypothetical protein
MIWVAGVRYGCFGVPCDAGEPRPHARARSAFCTTSRPSITILARPGSLGSALDSAVLIGATVIGVTASALLLPRLAR